MSKPGGNAGKINSELTKALAREVKEISEKDDEGNFKHPILDRMRVYNAALKLESIRLKVSDEGYGSNFGQTGEHSEK